MPRSARTRIRSSSSIWSTRSPFTHTTPPSAFSRPRISFRIVDLPAPLAPRMILVWPLISVKLTSRRITLSSKASDTLSNTTMGAPVASRISWRIRGSFNRHAQYIKVNSRRVMKKSTASTATDAATTALVVARPTPWVPPRVRRPT